LARGHTPDSAHWRAASITASIIPATGVCEPGAVDDGEPSVVERGEQFVVRRESGLLYP
jgi:hypothetical protein